MKQDIRNALLGLVLAGGIVHAAAAVPRATQTPHVPAEAIAANYVGPLPPDQRLHLAITLPMHNLQILQDFLVRLQDRRSPDFRHYLSVDEFTSRFGPTAAEYRTLAQFAGSHGLEVRATSPNRYVLDVEGSVASIQQAFGIRMGMYRHPNTSRVFYAPDREPSLEIATPVLHISGLDNAQPPVARSAHREESGQTVFANGSGPNGDYTAADMRKAYYGGTLTGAGQIVGVIAFAGFNIADIQQYFAVLGQSLTVPVVGIPVDGISLTCIAPGCDDFEQSIDIEQAIGMAPGLTQLSVYAGDTVIDILNRMATDDTAKSLSSSYGWGAEPAVEDPVYMEFQAQGQSFVDASGDMGWQLSAGGVWPADDAYVIGVGGTVLSTQWAGGPWLSETAWIDSGGGPSPDGIKIPQWQKHSINAANMGSHALRNVPDVAAEANYDNYLCFDKTCSGGNGGTSFAAPRWAGFLALVNQQAALNKEPSVGFMAGSIYPLSHSKAYNNNFHDITQGSNGKYPAVVGYDDVTGLGSPQAELVLSLGR